MKPVIAPLVISASMFLIAPSFAAPNAGTSLYNPEFRPDSTYSSSNKVPQAGGSYAYWHHHHWHHWHHHHWHNYHYW